MSQYAESTSPRRIAILRGLAGLLAAVLLHATLHCRAVLAEDGFVNIRLPSLFNAEAIRVIAELGEPETLRLSPGDDLQSAITRKCGGTDPAYLVELGRANPNVTLPDVSSTLTVETSLLFPACARMPKIKFERHIAKFGDKLAKLALENGVGMSATTPTGDWQRSSLSESFLKQIQGRLSVESVDTGLNVAGISWDYQVKQNADRIRDANTSLPCPACIGIGDAVMVPKVQPEWSEIRLKDGVNPSTAAEKITEALTPSAKPADLQLAYAHVLDSQGESPKVEVAFTSITGPVDVSSLAPECRNSGPDTSAWPFRLDQFKAALEVIKKVRPQEWQRFLRPGDILVVDSGFDSSLLDDAPFSMMPPRITGLVTLGNNPKFFVNPEQSLGANLAVANSDPARSPSYSLGWHGSSVAALALGGNQLPQLTSVLPLPVRVAHASVVGKDSTGGFIVPPAVLATAYEYAQVNGIPIMNFSVVTNAGERWSDYLKQFGKSVLLIAAAGNNKKSLDDTNIYPSSFGGPSADGWVITVGAVDDRGAMPDFSNRSASHVDLLAPGCNVPTIKAGANGGTEITRQSGTSFAAPLVSFVAAILWAEGLPLDEIKARIIASVDVRNDLDGVVYSRGILNAAKAIAVWTDVLEVKDGEGTKLRFGRVIGKRDLSSILKICGREENLGSIRKLSFKTGASNPTLKAHVWVGNTTGDGELRIASWTKQPNGYCDVTDQLNGQSLKFIDAFSSSQVPEEVPLSSIVDYVASEFTPN